MTRRTSLLGGSLLLFLTGGTTTSSFSLDRGVSSSQNRPGLGKPNVPPLPESLAAALPRWFQTAALSAAIASATFVPNPALVPSAHAAPTLDEAIVEVSESSYPILRALDPVGFEAFSTKLGNLLLRIPPEKLGKSIDLAIDVLDSAPADRLGSFNALLKETYADVSTDSCSLVPLPSQATVDKFAAVATETVAADKLKTFEETWKPSLEALKKTDTKICLPKDRASLDKLALAQADLARSFGKAESKAFAKYAGPVAKQSLPVGKLLDLASDAKKLTPTATAEAKQAFAKAGQRAEAASKLEVARIQYKEKQAAKLAATAKK